MKYAIIKQPTFVLLLIYITVAQAALDIVKNLFVPLMQWNDVQITAPESNACTLRLSMANALSAEKS